MKKNEQLLREFGRISPTYIQEAQPGRVPGKRTAQLIYIRKRSFVAAVAAMLAVSMMMFGFGFSVSAATNDPEREEYQVGSMLMDIPEILTQQDFEAILAEVKAGIEADTTLPEDARKHWARRFQAFWALQSLEDQNSELAREGLLKKYPIVEITNVYTVDINLTKDEREFLHHMIVTYADMTQIDLIDTYQKLYDLTENSNLSNERKQAIGASLPDIPAPSSSAPPANYLTEKAQAAGKSQMTPAMLPYVLLPEDYASIRDAVLAKYGVESVELLPMQAQKFLKHYTKYPLQLENPESYQVMAEQHFAQLTADMELYILDPTLPMEESVILCYQFATEADVWGEDAVRMANHLNDTLEARYPGKLEPTWGWVRNVVMSYWRNWMWIQILPME